jgi:hypothetical protein
MGNKGSWGKTQEAMENSGGGLFLRLENDGDAAVVAFCGAPLPRDITFNERTKNYEPWDESHKAAGRKKQTKYAMNVYALSALGKRVDEMKVIDMNFNTLTAVIALKDKYGFSKCYFEIKRHGAKGDTKTTYQILPDQDIKAEDLAIFGSADPKDADNWIEGTVKLIDLDEVVAKADDESTAVTDDVKKETKSKGGAKATNGTATAPVAPAASVAVAPAASAATNGESISKAVATEIIEKLKPLDPDKGIRPFMKSFPYAKKVSEIRASDEMVARKLANDIVSPPSAAEDAFG